MIRPKKLKKGDEIRIIAPSRSLKLISDEGLKTAKKKLEDLGLKVTFGKHVMECDLQQSSSISNRIEDLHNAFADPNVRGILTVIGGFNCNELLTYIDYELLKKNPKIICGFSDITALTNAITIKCGFITYSGPHFSSFAMNELQEYQTSYFRKCFMQEDDFNLYPSHKWSDDAWYLNQNDRHFEATKWTVYSEGSTSGTIFGGNLCTLNLLQGTDYMPSTEDCILFIEDDFLVSPEIFARDLTSLLQAIKGNVKGLLLGRFQKASNMTEEQLHFILDKHPQLKTIPVLYGLDFGHTQPIMTLPIGGEMELDTARMTLKLTLF